MKIITNGWRGNMLNQENNVHEAYKNRFIFEYSELKIKYQKLHKMLVKYDAGKLDFTFSCPVELLRKQKATMEEYLNILEIRAEMEDIPLE